jgi:hypothetical protein
MGVVWLAKPEQVGNAPSQRFCLFPSPQLNVELNHGGEIIHRTRTGFLNESTSAPVFASRQLFFAVGNLISMEFPSIWPRDTDGRRNGSPESNWMVVNKLNAIACRHRRNKISGFEMGCVESESPAMLRIAEDGVW